jgi:hypothetical protein
MWVRKGGSQNDQQNILSDIQTNAVKTCLPLILSNVCPVYAGHQIRLTAKG